MLKFVLKRLVWLFPSIFMVSIVIFLLQYYTTGGDLSKYYLSLDGNSTLESNYSFSEEKYLNTRQTLHEDLPLFYFQISTKAYPDTLYKIPFGDHRKTLDALLWEYGDWRYIEEYYNELIFQKKIFSTKLQTDSVIKFEKFHKELLNNVSASETEKIFERYSELSKNEFSSFFLKIRQKWEKVKSEASPRLNYIPALRIYGFQNRYHIWLTNFCKGDLGVSLRNSRKVSEIITESIPWSLGMGFGAMILAVGMSIPLGLWLAKNQNSRKDKLISTLLFGLYSVPVFWLAAILITFLAQPQYLKIFPTSGIGEIDSTMSIWQVINIRFSHLVLPLICWSVPSIIFLTQQVRGNVINSLSEPHLLTAYAKGLPAQTVLLKHGFRNALIPLITIFTQMLPSVLVGSFVIETIFALPGIGKLFTESIILKDYPVVIAITILISFFTFFAYLVGDILKYLAEPRIRK